MLRCPGSPAPEAGCADFRNWHKAAVRGWAEHIRFSAQGISDINLFRYCQGVIDLNAEIADRTFDLGMPEQELDGP